MFKNALLCATFVVASAGTSLVASQASAADYSWTGLYAGASAGVASVTTKTTTNSLIYTSYLARLQSQGAGVAAGLTLGYNYQFSSPYLVGLEADYSLATAGNSGTSNGSIIGQQTNISSLGTVRGRFGYVLDKNLFYATAGVAMGEVRSHAIDALISNPPNYNTVAKNQLGWVVGAGYERALSSNISTKFEVLYADFGKESALNGAGNTQTFAVQSSIARAGVNVKF